MPDVQEVFRMATQKVGPEPGALERQNRSQRRQSVTRKAGGYALLAIIVIAAAVISVLALRPREQQPADQPEREAPTTAELATHPHFLDLETGEARLLPESLEGGYAYAASPEGTRLAYAPAARGGCVGPGVITVANVDGTGVRTIESPRGLTLCAPRWSPDGTKLIYQARDGSMQDDVGNLYVHDLTTGETTQVTDLELTTAWPSFLSPTFSADGEEVLFHLPRGPSQNTTWDVWSVPVTGGEPILLLEDASFPMANPGDIGEDMVIQFTEPAAGDFAGLSLMTARPGPGNQLRSKLVEANDSIWWPTLSPDGSRIAYQDGGAIFVADLLRNPQLPGPSVEVTEVGRGGLAEWLDNDTLIVSP